MAAATRRPGVAAAAGLGKEQERKTLGSWYHVGKSDSIDLG
jgi:hypothetical protein